MPDNAESVRGLLRSRAVELVDGRHGYTVEFSSSPNSHAAEYDEVEAQLLAALTGVCEFCGEPLGGGPGGWHSLLTTLERCPGPSTTAFHEPAPIDGIVDDAIPVEWMSCPRCGHNGLTDEQACPRCGSAAQSDGSPPDA